MLICLKDLVFDSTWLFLEPDMKNIKTNILIEFRKKTGGKRWAQNCQQIYLWFVFYPIWTTLTLTSGTFRQEKTETVTYKVLTRFLTGWPMLWPYMTHIWTWPEIIKTNILTRFLKDWTETVASTKLTKISFDLTGWPSF